MAGPRLRVAVTCLCVSLVGCEAGIDSDSLTAGQGADEAVEAPCGLNLKFAADREAAVTAVQSAAAVISGRVGALKHAQSNGEPVMPEPVRFEMCTKLALVGAAQGLTVWLRTNHPEASFDEIVDALEALLRPVAWFPDWSMEKLPTAEGGVAFTGSLNKFVAVDREKNIWKGTLEGSSNATELMNTQKPLRTYTAVEFEVRPNSPNLNGLTLFALIKASLERDNMCPEKPFSE